MIEPQDLRAAVQRGLISEAQAAGLVSIAAARQDAKTDLSPAEEPFVLFKGFNEIFIVIGLSILFTGWAAVATVFGAELFDAPVGVDTVVIAVATLAGLAAVQRYFTLTRRMIAPSIALAVMFALTASVLGHALADLAGLRDMAATSVRWGSVTVVMVLHYLRFRVPFDAAIIATAAFATLTAAFAGAGVMQMDSTGFLFFAGSGPVGVLSLAFGLACFALALRFDMSDPLRISTRSTTGFWLHVVSAPAIINTLAINLLDQGQGGQLALLAVLVVLALVAVVIDRRSFLVSGAGYAFWLTLTLFDSSALVILLLGLGLVFLGAQWDRLRRALMQALPDFPGKTRLPPYGRTE